MRRAATVTATVPATTSTMTPSTASSTGKVSECALSASTVRNVSGQIRSMIEKKISRLAPLPIPRSVICSPSHITKIPPVDHQEHRKGERVRLERLDRPQRLGPDPLDDREEDQQARPVADPALRDLLPEPHHENPARGPPGAPER